MIIVPFISTRGIISFPASQTTLEIGRAESLLQLSLANKHFNNEIVLISQKDHQLDNVVEVQQMHKYGTLVHIEELNSLISGHKKIKVTGIKRVEIVQFKNKVFNNVKSRLLEVNDVVFQAINSKNIKVYMEKINIVLTEIFKSNRNISSKTLDNIKKTKGEMEGHIFLNLLAEALPFTFEKKYDIFKQNSLDDKAKVSLQHLIEYRNMINLDVDLDKDIKKNLDIQQQEFLLREKLKVIQQKLDESSSKEEKKENYMQSKIGKHQYPKIVRDTIKKEKAKLKSLMSSSPEANTSRTYIDWLVDLPWRKVSTEHLEIKKAEQILENHHYGLKEIKERIIEFLAVMVNNKTKNSTNKDSLIETKDKKYFIDKNIFVDDKNNVFGSYIHNLKTANPIITLVGPPGTGKTTLAKSIAETLGRKFVKISLGGVRDEAEIRGHRRTYVSSMPGKIINAIKKATVSNPVILLDEIDKMSSDYKGDPTSALLEVLDPEQNTNFQDHYLEIEYDLSKILFIATANYHDYIPAPLLDRVEIIELNSYTLLEKINIAKTHLIAKTLEKHSLEKKLFEFNDDIIEFVIKYYTLEAGVRDLQRVLDKIARKIVLKHIVKPLEKFKVTIENVKEFLGPQKFDKGANDVKPQIGSVNGLAYTQYGGSALSIEVATFPGKGEIKLTGQLKDIMQESAQIALGYVRSHAKEYGIKFDFDKNQIHIHVPEGAVPKDGPSAGITFTTAIISALKKEEVSHNVGMTGEITLRGKILPIGGLKEKSLAAQKHGIKTVFIPQQNKKNLVDIPIEVRKSIKYIPVSNYREIFTKLFG